MVLPGLRMSASFSSEKNLFFDSQSDISLVSFFMSSSSLASAAAQYIGTATFSSAAFRASLFFLTQWCSTSLTR